MIVAEVPAVDVPRIWPRVLPDIVAALAQGHGEYEPDDVLAACERGDWRMLIGTRPGELVAVACAGVIVYPRARHLWVHVAGGRGMHDGVAAFMPAWHQMAAEGGCSMIGFQGRRGWARSKALPGWTHDADILTIGVAA